MASAESGPGVYAIQHTASGKRYVGSGKSVRGRWKTHRWALRKGRHANKPLQNAWNKYGEDAFEWQVLELLPDESQLLAREQWWIDHLRACERGKGYNVCPIAGSTRGYKASAETKAKISTSLLGNKHTAGKPLTQEHKNNISLGLKGKVRISDRQKQVVANALSLSWRVTKPDGTTVDVTNLRQFAQAEKVPLTTLFVLASGRTKKNREGWKCERLSAPRTTKRTPKEFASTPKGQGPVS